MPFPARRRTGIRFSVLHMDRRELYSRIERRVDEMLAGGLLDEVRHLRDQGPALPALRTIGYQEPWAYLDGAYGWSRMVELIKRNTRRYAKRQLTWFRRYPEYRWVDVADMHDVLLCQS